MLCLCSQNGPNSALSSVAQGDTTPSLNLYKINTVKDVKQQCQTIKAILQMEVHGDALYLV